MATGEHHFFVVQGGGRNLAHCPDFSFALSLTANCDLCVYGYSHVWQERFRGGGAYVGSAPLNPRLVMLRMFHSGSLMHNMFTGCGLQWN